jgi:hypothetical protein
VEINLRFHHLAKSVGNLMKHLAIHTPRPKIAGLLLELSMLLAACNTATTTPGIAGSTPRASASTLVTYSSTPGASASTPGASTTAAAGGSVSVMVSDNATLGKILVTSTGMTLEVNPVDTAEDIECTQAECVNE